LNFNFWWFGIVYSGVMFGGGLGSEGRWKCEPQRAI